MLERQATAERDLADESVERASWWRVAISASVVSAPGSDVLSARSAAIVATRSRSSMA